MKVIGSSSKPSASLMSLDSFILVSYSGTLPRLRIIEERGLDPSITDCERLPNYCYDCGCLGIMKLDAADYLVGVLDTPRFV